MSLRTPSALVLGTVLTPLVAMSLTAAASAQVFYSNTFEHGSTLPEWSSNQRYTEATNFSRFLGRYINNTVTLTLQAPPGPRDEVPPGGGGGGSGGGDGGGGDPPPPPPPPSRAYLLQFWFYCIDSWDGNDPTYGPDHFSVRVNSSTIFNETFANQHSWQSYPHEPDVGRTQLGFDERWNDSIYHLSIPFSTDATTLHIDFLAWGLLGSMSDESWGIDNISVSRVPVPAPGAGALVGLGGMMALRRRRR